MNINVKYSQREHNQIDIIKGLLIIFVIAGHVSWRDETINSVIFWFHMPLFFFISGMLYHKQKHFLQYLIKRSRRLLIPYFGWYIVNSLIFPSNLFSLHSWLRFIWGGRAIAGVYWFTTCLLLSGCSKTRSD